MPGHAARVVRSTLLVALGAAFLVPVAPPASAAVLEVTTRQDELNVDGDCSLREAIVAVNTSTAQDACPAGSPEGDVIRLKRGTYTLTRTGPNEDAASTGDLDVLSADTTIRGKGMNSTTVDADDIDRVFHLNAASKLQGLTVTGGELTGDDGAGIFVGASVILDNVRVTDNEVTGTDYEDAGGGIINFDNLVIRDSDISANTAPSGGGLFNVGGMTLDVKRSAFHDNVSTLAYGGGGLNLHGTTTLENVTIARNTSAAGGHGSGFTLGQSSTMELRRSTVASNDPGNVYVDGDMTMSSSIVADPLGTTSCLVDTNGDITAEAVSVDEDGTCADGTGIEEDPKLEPVGEYGGPVPTSALLPGSPAINASLEDCVGTDARGVPRPQANCDVATTNLQDIGAYERVRCGKSVVNRVGTPGRDVLRGGGGVDVFLGLGGSDKILAGAGNDRACGGDGKDTIKGEDGDDKLFGQAGDDRLVGGTGADLCVGGPGTDSASQCETKRGL